MEEYVIMTKNFFKTQYPKIIWIHKKSLCNVDIFKIAEMNSFKVKLEKISKRNETWWKCFLRCHMEQKIPSKSKGVKEIRDKGDKGVNNAKSPFLIEVSVI